MAGGSSPALMLMVNSIIMSLAIAVGKIAISLLSAFAIVYFRFPLRMFFFWMIFITLMLPVEVRILPTYKIVADLGMLDSYGGLVLPLIASATATFRSEEHTSELQSLMRTSYAVFCLKKKKNQYHTKL